MDPVQVTAELLKLGLPGVVILAIAWAAKRLWSAYEAESRARLADIKELQEARIRESREAAEKLHQATSALNANTKAIEALGDLIRDQRGR